MTITRFLPPPRALPMLAGVLVFLLAGLHGCTPEPREPDPPPPGIDYSVLPPITQEGKNTFGCKVNGVVWVPRVEIIAPWFPLYTLFNEKGNNIGIGNVTCRLLTTKQDDFMQLIFGPTNFSAGIYPVKNGISTDLQLNIGPDSWYKTNPNDSISNWVSLAKIDTALNIVSGTFQFKLFNTTNPNDSVWISEGRFDLNYSPL